LPYLTNEDEAFLEEIESSEKVWAEVQEVIILINRALMTGLSSP
jgi:hypothetical protein